MVGTLQRGGRYLRFLLRKSELLHYFETLFSLGQDGGSKGLPCVLWAGYGGWGRGGMLEVKPAGS